MAWQLKVNHSIYFLDCTNELTQDERRLVRALFAHPMVVCDTNDFLDAVLCTFGHRPARYTLPKTPWKSPFFPTYATNNKRPYCRLTKKRVLQSHSDVDAILRWHVATEVDFLSTYHTKSTNKNTRAEENRKKRRKNE